MNRRIILSGVASLLLAVPGGVVPIYAQTQTAGSGRPYARLFGTSTSERASGHSLDFVLSLSEGYNDDTSSLFGSLVDFQNPESKGLQTMLLATTSYLWRGSRVQFAANSASAMAHYDELSETRSISHTLGVGFVGRLSSQTSLLVNQSAAYSPSYLYGLFPRDAALKPGGEIPAAPEFAVRARDTYTYGTSMMLTQKVTPRNSISAIGEFNYTDYVQESELTRDMKVASIQGLFSRNVKRNTAVRASYRYRQGDIGFGLESTIEHGIDIGVNHDRPLSATRRALLGLRIGSSVVKLPESAQERFSLTGRRHLLEGELMLGYQFARTWQARSTYRRAMEYVAALTEPVVTSGFSANVDGTITRRVDVVTSVGYSSGESLFNRSNSAFETYTGDLRVQYAFHRSLAAYAQYLYYSYDFRGNTQLVPGIAPRFERNAVRAGFMLWLPVLKR